MDEYKNNSSFISLRAIIAEKTNPIVLWIGAGLSASIGLPLWNELKRKLIDIAPNHLSPDSVEAERQRAKLELAKKEKDNWLAFSHIKEVLGKSLYESSIRDIYSKAENEQIPKNYKQWMKLRPRGIVTTNIDGLSGRAFAELEGHKVIEFVGVDSERFAYAMQSEKPFVLDLHGKYSDAMSWVFTKEELGKLQKTKGYELWINHVLQKTIIFIGTSIYDISVRKHIEKFSSFGFKHYWITSENTKETYEFCKNNGILVISYSSDNNHEELDKIINDLIQYRSKEVEGEPVSLPIEYDDSIEIGSERYMLLPLNEQRKILNAKVTKIFNTYSADAYENYRQFRKQNMRYIHNSWYVGTDEPDNLLFGYRLKKLIGSGAFGDVYQGMDEAKKEEIAIKILKQDILQNDAKLQAFRRGVRAMQILSKHCLEGIVKYIGASEIPSIVVMEYVNGMDLKEAVDAKDLLDFEQKFEILCSISDIMKKAHQLPERVLHRDLRPQNIMLRDFYLHSDEIEVVLLDFDLSWYKDSTEVSVNQAGSSNGFLAPELENHKMGQNTRTAQVDSFGMGMLVYYVFTGKEPFHNQHLSGTWEEDVFMCLDRLKSPNWHSIPYVLCRLIVKATSENQTTRPDMSQIHGKLYELCCANNHPEEVRSAGIIAEEIICRIWSMKGKNRKYEVNEDKNEYSYSFENGISTKLIANESQSSLSIFITWDNKGNASFKKVKQNKEDIIQSLKTILEQCHFRRVNAHSDSHSFNITAEVRTIDIVTAIEKFVKQLLPIVQKI